MFDIREWFLRLVTKRLDQIMADQATIATAITAVSVQINDVAARIPAALANADAATPELVAAVDALTTAGAALVAALPAPAPAA